MGCCFGKNEDDRNVDETSPLITSTDVQQDYQSEGTSPNPIVKTEQRNADVSNAENAAHSFQFIHIDQNTDQAKDHTDRSAFYRDKFGSYLRDTKVVQVLPNVIDPTTVLLLPCTGKEELEQVRQSCLAISNLIEQMKPKGKEPITAPALD